MSALSVGVSGLNIQHVINAACDTQAMVDVGEREKAQASVAASFIDILDMQAPSLGPRSRSLIGRLKCNR